MEKAEWIKRITAACEEVGTYRPAFNNVIDTLADILERRDQAQKTFFDTGGNVIVTHTNKGGNKNTVVHPQLKVVQECESSALAYWRELGLTPSAFKKLTDTEVKQIRQMDPLSAALKDLDFTDA